jgi:excisionase family DNA binding protein
LSPTDTTSPPYLTTREVAALLRVKERKVYDLAAAGEIPHRRITGKLLFPAEAITRWIERGDDAGRRGQPAILAGSHDPLLDWAVRESGCGLASFYDGSTDGLDRFARGAAALSGLHIPEENGWNVATVSERAPRDAVLIAWAARSQGLIVGPGAAGAIAGLADLAGRRVVLRQPGAGARLLFERLAAGAGLDMASITPVPGAARTEADVATAIASGEAEAGIGLESVARQYRLGFVPLVVERFDLLVDRRSWFTEPVQTLIAFARTGAFRARAEALGGYDVSEIGAVRWLSD